MTSREKSIHNINYSIREIETFKELKMRKENKNKNKNFFTQEESDVLSVFDIFKNRWSGYNKDGFFYDYFIKDDQIFENFFIISTCIILELISIVLYKHSDINCIHFHVEMTAVIQEFVKLKNLFKNHWGYFTYLNFAKFPFFDEVGVKKLNMIHEIENHMYTLYGDVKKQMRNCIYKDQCADDNFLGKNCIPEQTMRYFKKLLKYIPDQGLDPFKYPEEDIESLYPSNGMSAPFLKNYKPYYQQNI